MIIGKDIRREDGLVANYSGDEFTGFPFLLEDIYDQLDGAVCKACTKRFKGCLKCQ